MAEAADASDLNWYLPEQRGQLPIANLHVPKSLRKLLLKTRPFTVNVNTDFRAIIAMCAEETQDRPSTWINDTIIDLYCDLHAAGHAHSVECRDPSSGEIFGGLYGVSIGQIFCGESMVSRAPNASKVALVHLCARLQAGGFMCSIRSSSMIIYYSSAPMRWIRMTTTLYCNNTHMRRRILWLAT